MQLEKWHKDFGQFLCKQSKVWKCALRSDSFVQSIQRFRWKSTESLWLMTLKSDTKFEEKLNLGSKNVRNLVNFNASSGKSENLHVDVLLLSIACKVSAENVQKNNLLWQWNKIQNFGEKLTFYLKNDLRNLVNFNLSSGKFKNLHFDGILL